MLSSVRLRDALELLFVIAVGGMVVSAIGRRRASACASGASGAIVGVVGILVGNTIVTHWIARFGRTSTQKWRFNPSVARSLAIQIVIWIAITAVYIKEIDNWAHIGGGIAGIVIGAAVAWYRSTPAAA